MKKVFLNITILLISMFSFAQDRTKWFEFYLPWNDSSKTVTDMSAYLDAPAGKHGFLQVTPDGHFKFENKTETERFVGVVNVAIANFPTKTEANIIAARMAKFGINLVRIHLMDVEGNYGLFQNSSQNTLQISADRLDKMDYFIKCLKDRGIYFNFCIHAGRIYKTADGIDSPVKNDQSKYVTLFNKKIIDLQKDFAQKIIGHVNPYTKLTYADDPAMANLELTNENSMFNGWLGWNSDYIFGDVTGGIGPFYSAELDTKFNNWLAAKYENDSLLELAWQGNGSGAVTELIKNGSFEQNLTNWSPLVAGGATGTITSDATVTRHGTKSVKISVTKAGTENWHIQLKTNNFRVEKNKDYKIGFYAKADVAKEVRMEVMENQTWKWITGPFYNTTTDWKYYEVFFNSPFASNALIVAFEWGKQTGTFWLDSVTVSETFGIGLEEVESLAAKNVKRTRNSELGKYTKQRVGDNSEFYFDIEKKYTEVLSGFLKNDLNVKCPVTFTNNYFGLAEMYAQSQADYIDFHMYWDHPNFPNGWSNIDFTLNNKSILLNPEGSTINKMPLTKVRNMPHVLSEYNHAYPYIFQTEAPSLLYAYGSFFDLDGIVWHAYYDYMNNFSQRHQDMFFDIAMHPVMMTQMLLALPYRMKYIQKARTFVEGNYRKQDIFNNTKIYQDNDVINIEDVNYGTSFLKHGFQHASFEADSTFLSGTLTSPGKVITSETGELMWDGNQGFFRIDNPYWQGATGYLGGKTIDLGNITISNVTTTDNLNFASIQLISLDSLPILQSRKMILLTSARLEDQGLKWNDTNTGLVSAGGTRALCEPVEAVITFKSSSPDSLSVYMLNPTGNRADSLLVSQTGESVKFSLNKNTLWYEISNHLKKKVTSGKKTGINQNMMNIYPNPGKEYSVIEFSFPVNDKADFILYNAFGQMIMNEPVLLASNQLQQKRVDVSHLNDGIYFYGFQFKNGKRVIDKLVILK
jgi:hypothetical protein